MRVVTLVLAFVLAAGPALAQEQPSIRSSIEHAAAAASSEPSSDTSRHPLFWSGLALAAAGTMVAILGTTAFKSEETASGNAPTGSFQGCEALKSNPVYAANQCDVLKGPNPGIVWSGIGVASLGITLMALQRAHSSIEIGPGAVRVQHRIKF